jgi:NitT/TauT family transport system substrate-binding protein
MVTPRPLAPLLLGLALAACSSSTSPRPEPVTLRIAEQFGISYLPLQMIREHGLIEQHAERLGIEVTTEWLRYSGGAEMNGALLDDDLDVASGGVAPLLTIWDQTRGSLDVKGIACLNEMPLFLNTNQEEIETLSDFGAADRIALPSVGVSIQALTLQMASEQAGMAFDALDGITVALSHPEGMAALTSADAAITGHFTSPPFMYQELENEDPRIHTVVSSYDVLGGPSTFNCVWARSSFREEKPEAYQAFVDALAEAVGLIEADTDAAVDVYIRQTGSELDPAFVRDILNQPDIAFTLTPANIMKYAEFMHRVGALGTQPAGWSNVFFEEAHELDGS